MDEDPGRAVRVKRDSSLVRCAEAVREGRACAMVSAGNTGAAMASALLRMGRLPGVSRPAIATVIPVPGLHAHRPHRLRRQRRLHGPDARPVRPDGMGAGHRALRHTRPPRRHPVHRRGGHQGQRPGEGGPRPARRRRRGAGRALHRQRRRPGRDERQGGRRRDRRLYRQRRAEDPGRGREGRGRGGARARSRAMPPSRRRPRRCCRRSVLWPTSSTPTPTAGRCSSGSRACASSATARRAHGPSSTP